MDAVPLTLTDPEKFCVEQLKVLADETRLAVLNILRQGPCHVGEINAQLGLEQSLLSHHLKVLRQAQLVIAERDGKAVLYRLRPEVAGPSPQSLNLGCCLLCF